MSPCGRGRHAGKGDAGDLGEGQEDAREEGLVGADGALPSVGRAPPHLARSGRSPY
jgi:hypothetical protein